MTIQYKQLSNAALFCTVTLMLLAVKFTLSHKSDLLDLPISAGIIAGIVAGITSVGTYSFLTRAFLYIFGKIRWLRKLILGDAYIEGTWVGFYKHGDLNRFTIEFINQQSKKTIVHGREFDEHGNARGRWTSDLIKVDGFERYLEYSYICRMHNSKSLHEGLAHFDILLQTPSSPPYILEGYSADLIDGDKDPNKEYKIAETVIRDEDALREAHRIFVLGQVPTDYPYPNGYLRRLWLWLCYQVTQLIVKRPRP